MKVTNYKIPGKVEEITCEFLGSKENKKLAIMYPGIGYTCDMPMLYFTTNLMLELGYNVIQFRSHYPEFMPLNTKEKKESFLTPYKDDVFSFFDHAISNYSSDKIILIGKSLGTRAISILYQSEKYNAVLNRVQGVISFTPVLKDEDVIKGFKKVNSEVLHIVGGSDKLYCPFEIVTDLTLNGPGKVLLIEGGNHSLECKKSVISSVKGVSKYIDVIKSFCEGLIVNE